jgi:ribose transport system substrate-binding protein
MRSLRIVAVAAAALLAAALPACNTAKGPAKPKVGFVTNNPADFWNIAQAGCKKAADEFGVEVDFQRPDDAAAQKEIIDTMVQKGVKALAVSVIEPEKQRAYLDEIAAKVKLITVDNDAPKTGRIAYIGTDNYKAGRAVGRLVQEALPDGGTLCIFVGQTEPLNARQRHQGVLDELAGRPTPPDINQAAVTADGSQHGKFRLFKTYTDRPEGEVKAKTNAVDAITQLQQEKGPICFVGLWAYNPPAILAALKDKSKLGAIKVVGFDENFATLDGIRDGHVYATVVQDPFNFGYESVKLMAALLQKGDEAKPKDPLVYVPERIIMKDATKGKDNTDRLAVEPFRRELEERLKK